MKSLLLKWSCFLFLSAFVVKTHAQLSPVVLPLYENFERAQGSFIQDSNCVYCDTNIQFDVRFIVPGFFQKEVSFDYGYSNTSIGSGDTVSALLHGQNSVNALRATIDMSNYDTSDASTILLSFFHYNHYDEVDPEDEVRVKGSASSTWIPIYDMGRTGVAGQWVEASNLNITEILKSNNQNFSSSFQIRFSQKDNDFNVLNDGRSIDDIFLEEVSCAPVANAMFSNATDTSVDILWQPVSAQAITEVYFGLSGFLNHTQGTKVYANSSLGLLNVGSLSPNTCYDFYIRQICGVGDSSKWVGPLNFCTNCSPITLPYFENFDGLTNGLTGNLGNCWITSTNSNFNNVSTSTSVSVPYFFKGNKGIGNFTAIGPYYHANVGFGSYVMAEGSSINSTDTTYMELNTQVDLSGLPNRELRFSYYIQGGSTPPATNKTLVVEIDSGNGWHSLSQINTPRISGRNGPWSSTAISLNGYNGLVKIRFVSKRDYYIGFVALDDIAIDKPLTCPWPNRVSASAISLTSAAIAFTSNVGVNTQHEISYGPALTHPDNGTKTLFTGSSVNLNGLTSGQQYCVYIRNICALGDSSYWSEVYCFNTECPPLTVPYRQNFDTLTATPMPLCWNAIGPQTDTTVQIVSSTDQGASMPSPPFGVEINDGVSPVMLISPKFADLKSGLNRIRFKAAYEISSSYFPNDTLFIGTVTDLNNPSSFKRLTYLNILPPRAQFQEYIIDLTDTALLDNNVHIAFKYGTDLRSRFEYYVDDFNYEAISSCPRPLGLVVTDSTCTGVELSWSSPSSTSILKYESKNSFGQTITNYVGHVASPYLVQGLDDWKKYDFFVADTCMGDTSVYFGPASGSPDENYLPTAKIVVLKDSTFGGVTFLTLDGSQSTEANWYEWDFGDGRTATGPIVNITFTNSGLANIVLSVRNKCIKRDTALFQYNVISLDESSYISKVRVYPNPTKGSLVIDLGEDYKAYTHFEVYNSIGQLMLFEYWENQSPMQLNINGSRGMYLIKVYRKSGSEIGFKVFKE